MARPAARLRLETAGVVHAAVVAALQAACFDEAWDAQSMAAMLSASGGLGLIALDGGEPVGCILCRIAADEAEVITIAVLPAARRRGAGAALLTAAEAAARRRGAAAMFLEVAADNAAGLALYGGRGYRDVGRRRGYYRRRETKVDAILMKKTLAEKG